MLTCREMVVHCGSEHGFALYYLLLDENIGQTRTLLLQSNVKLEPPTEEEEENHLQLDVKPDLSNIKIEVESE